MSEKRRIEVLSALHPLEAFDCGSEDLNRWLKKYALLNQSSNSAKTYVAIDDDQVVGFYSLAYGQVEHAAAGERLKKGLAKHPIPVMLLARLAVDKDRHGEGIGKGLLKDAVLRTVAAANIAGLRALIVHAKDDRARAYYERFDFQPSPTDPLHLYALVKDLQKTLGDE